MQKIRLYQVDAFTDRLFKGNPAAVCPLDDWISDDLMQKIAAENNLSETAFFVKKDDNYEIRWFTPLVEVNLCGHATLASAFVIFEIMDYPGNQITFISAKSGILKASKEGSAIFLDFPADEPSDVENFKELDEALRLISSLKYKGKTDYLVLLNDENDVLSAIPDFEKLRRLDCRGIIITAMGKDVDFVSRFFAPAVGVNEDPVTGSAHTLLIPFWSKRLNKKIMKAKQLSDRGGTLICKITGNRVHIGGSAALYLQGEISLSE